MANKYAHAAACVRFVAALDAGEIRCVATNEGPASERVELQLRKPRECTRWHAAPTALAAFRAAQDHLKGGPDDGQ